MKCLFLLPFGWNDNSTWNRSWSFLDERAEVNFCWRTKVENEIFHLKMKNANVKNSWWNFPQYLVCDFTKRIFRGTFSNSNQIIPLFCNSSSFGVLAPFTGFEIRLLHRHTNSPSTVSVWNHVFMNVDLETEQKASITVINYIKNAFWKSSEIFADQATTCGSIFQKGYLMFFITSIYFFLSLLHFSIKLLVLCGNLKT